MSSHPPTSADTTRSISRSDIIDRIISGQNIVIYKCLALNLTRWAKVHPGGELAVLHFVGRDATDEMTAYHTEEDLEMVKRFVIGKVEGMEKNPWKPLAPPVSLGLIADPTSPTGWRKEGSVRLGESATALDSKMTDADKAESKSDPTHPRLTSNMLELSPDLTSSAPPLDPKVEAIRSKAYHQLRTRLIEEGMFEMPDVIGGYGPDLVRYSLLGGMSAYLYFTSTSIWGQIASAAFLGALWQQLTFVAHDAGHNGITGVAFNDRLIGSIIANWIGGLSLGWWKDNHNIHHLVTNHPEHDPDIQHIPFFSISSQFFENLWSTYYKRVMAMDAFAKVLLQVQHKIYYFVLSLARFNLYANSYGFLALKAKRNSWFWFELAGLGFFWTWYGCLLYSLPDAKTRVLNVLVSHIMASPVHVQVRFLSPACFSFFFWICGTSLTISCLSIADRTLPLCAFNRRSRTKRVFPVSSIANNHGRRLFTFHRVRSWWFTPSSYPSPLPSTPKTQSAQGKPTCQRVL